MEQQAALSKPPRRSGAMLAIGGILALVLAGGGFAGWRYVGGQRAAATATAEYVRDYGDCGLVVLEEAISALDAVSGRWDDAIDLASSTSRIALAGPVANLQGIRQEVVNTDVPKCLVYAKNTLALSMEQAIAGFLAFMGQEPERDVTDLFEAANTYLRQYVEEKVRVRGCAPDCP